MLQSIQYEQKADGSVIPAVLQQVKGVYDALATCFPFFLAL